jgi:hypothetical protein
MSTAVPGDLTASAVIESLESGAYPRETVATIARGFLPLSQEDLITVLAFLASSGDEEISGYARAALEDLPARAMFDYASNESIGGEHLLRLVKFIEDNIVLEALIRNRALPDAAVATLARGADGRIQEVIVINQARILRAPEILDALLENPGLTGDVRRRALETKEEFFEKRARLQQIEEEERAEQESEPEVLEEVSDDAIADLLEKAAEYGDEASPLTVPITESDRVDEKKTSLWSRLQFMSVSEKVQAAFKGDRMTRMILIRERNKLVCSAVIRNPRISETEVEAVAGMRNVEDEVLRLISVRRDWMSKYNIVLTLCRNPKVPVGVVLPLINRLTLRDLKALKDDKGVQQIVREMAKKTYLLRTQKN